MNKETWNSFWYGRFSPYDLATARILFYGLILYSARKFDVHDWTTVPMELFDPLPSMKLLGYSVVSTPVVVVLQMLWKISLLFACLGLLTNISCGLATVLGFYLIALKMQFTMESHTSIVFVFTSLILTFSNCANVLSFDVLLRIRKRQVEPGANYCWPIRLITILYAMIFFSAGVTKILNAGIGWGGSTLQVILEEFRFRHALAEVYGVAKPGNPLIRNMTFILDHNLAALLGYGSLILELVAPLAVLRRPLGYAVLISLIGLNVGIFMTMGIDFFPLVPAAAFFVPWSQLGMWFKSLVRRA